MRTVTCMIPYLIEWKWMGKSAIAPLQHFGMQLNARSLLRRRSQGRHAILLSPPQWVEKCCVTTLRTSAKEATMHPSQNYLGCEANMKHKKRNHTFSRWNLWHFFCVPCQPCIHNFEKGACEGQNHRFPILRRLKLFCFQCLSEILSCFDICARALY